MANIPPEALRTAANLAKEQGVPLDNIVSSLIGKMTDAGRKRRSDNGKCRVLGVDKFDGSDWIQGEYDTAEEALRVAREQTREAMALASDHSIATVYFAYDPQGTYLGGDVWVNE